MTILNVGLIGLGEVAQSIHLPTLADLRDRFRIAAVHDVSAELTGLVSGRYADVRVHDSARALIDDPAIDAVFILSPDETHSRYVRMAIAAGKHILLEKPACLNLREIDELLPLAERHTKTLFVAYMRRYAPAYLAAKAELPPAAEITHVRIHDLISLGTEFMRHSQDILYPKDVPADLRQESAARREGLYREVVGTDAPPDLVQAYAILTSMSCHHLSAMRELIGEPKRVLAAHRTNGGFNNAITFDYGHYLCQYQAAIDRIGLFDAMIEVRSDRKRVRIVYDTPYIRSLPTRLEIAERGEDGVKQRILGPYYSDAFAAELKLFHRHVQDGTRPKTDLADFRKDLELWAAIVERMRDRPPT
ncbi:Gfo/Idh/MocA family protein [Geminicoccus roseus]|uniref:Gfo/Idh/MocA family protein n=1 Tax=Geminicoccus roseus TaxID=404900 RepID=UPI0003F7504A|nr:Gfo/Idh/MocA family oxidoreductase [Geminicoccus roseus]